MYTQVALSSGRIVLKGLRKTANFNGAWFSASVQPVEMDQGCGGGRGFEIDAVESMTTRTTESGICTRTKSRVHAAVEE